MLSCNSILRSFESWLVRHWRGNAFLNGTQHGHELVVDSSATREVRLEIRAKNASCRTCDADGGDDAECDHAEYADDEQDNDEQDTDEQANDDKMWALLAWGVYAVLCPCQG